MKKLFGSAQERHIDKSYILSYILQEDASKKESQEVSV